MVRCRISCRYAVATTALLAIALTAGCTPAGDSPFAGGDAAEVADPASLIGLAPQQIGETLGLPELQRLEPPAEVWQYRTQTCVLDLYLYEQDGGRSVVHYEARSRSNETVDVTQCVDSLVERSRVAAAEDTAGPNPAQL